MKPSILVVGVVTSTLLTGCFEKSKAAAGSVPLYQAQFVGMSKLNASTNASKLREVWSLPVSKELRDQGLASIAKAPFKLWQKSLPAGATDQAALIRPLLDDLVSAESYVEFNGPNTGFDSVIAVELDDQRAELWEKNLREILTGWKLPRPNPLPGTKGWETKGTGPKVKVQRVGKWLLTGWSLKGLSRVNALAETAAKTGRPFPPLKNEALLSLDADFPSLSRWIDVLRNFKLPDAHVSIFPRGEYLRTEARIHLSEPLKWKFEPWRIPTNLVLDPLSGFSVAQGIEPLLKSLPGFEDLGFKIIPSQVCSWALENTPLPAYWSFPVSDASNVLYRIAPKGEQFVKRYIPEPIGEFVHYTNRSQFTWSGLPLAIPTLHAVTNGSEQYLVAGLLPLLKTSKVAPTELMGQLANRRDLIYYDWELTSDRLPAANLFYQLLDVIQVRTISDTNATTVRWSDQTAPRLGNTITEITVASPTELKLVRKSHLGFTGFEIATLLRWIDSPPFPLGYEPPPKFRGKQRTPKLPIP